MAPHHDCACGALRKAKRSGVTKCKCWKSWAKVIKAVIEHPSECQKQRVFQGGLDFDEKGGVGGGGQKFRISRKTQFKVVRGGQFGAHFGPNRASLGAFELVLIESKRESDRKRPLRMKGDLEGQAAFACDCYRDQLPSSFSDPPTRLPTPHANRIAFDQGSCRC
jgi:hypothetical protein